MSKLPDVLFVVLDCVSARDLGEGDDTNPDLNRVSEVARSGFLFDHAVAPASWTLPSHESMFTGLYPWDTGIRRFPDVLPAGMPSSIAQVLTASGYTTACFSANPLINPATGLTRGFEVAKWGSFSDCSLRVLSRDLSGAHSQSSGLPERAFLDRGSPRLRALVDRWIRSHPLVADRFCRTLAWTLNRRSVDDALVAPWIEDAVDKWLSSCKAVKPAYLFVNLLDAHEPYIGLPWAELGIDDWLRKLVAGQTVNRKDYNNGLEALRDEQGLRDLHRATLRILNRRLETIFKMFAAHRDWDNTLVILCSDHGQALGEGARLFHESGGPSSVHRVPLVIKPECQREGPAIISRWTSTTDISNVIRSRVLGGSYSDFNCGSKVERSSDTDDLGIALSYGEPPHLYDNLAESELAALPGSPSCIVGFSAHFKVVCTLPDFHTTAFRISSWSEASVGHDEVHDSRLVNLSQSVLQVAHLAVSRRNTRPSPDATSKPLDLWGY